MGKVHKITFQGNPLTLSGPVPGVGEKAPDFRAVDRDLKEVTLGGFKGKIIIISSTPSLDTPVCSAQLRKFNEEAARLGGDVAVINISMDLPFAISRFCATEGIEKAVALSDHKYASFGEAYGLLIEELRLLARAVLVIDRDGTIRLVEVVPELATEPDYRCAVAEAEKLLAKVG
jgi:thiol peroxidase